MVFLAQRNRKEEMYFSGSKNFFVIITLMFVLFAELAYPHDEMAVHDFPIEVYNVRHYEHIFNKGAHRNLESRFYWVATDQLHKYIIGIIIEAHYLCALIAVIDETTDRWGRPNMGKVKIRIDGEIANVTEPIEKNDPLNHLYGSKEMPPLVAAHINL